MSTVDLQLHNELADWLRGVATTRNVTLDEAILQLLEEQRMRDQGITTAEVPIGDKHWKATMPFRGLVYEGYEMRWERIGSDGSSTAGH